MIIECPNCQKNVLLLPNNICPSCNKDPKSFIDVKSELTTSTLKMVMPRYQTLPKRILSILIDGIPFVLLGIYLGNYKEGNDLQYYLRIVLIGLFWQIYSIIMIIKFGGTLGKLAVGVRIMEVNEKSWPNLRQALIRDCVWIASYVISAILMTIKIYQGESLNPIKSNVFEDILYWAGFVWMVTEIITAFGNNKRRAIHDRIANTVVVIKSKKNE